MQLQAWTGFVVCCTIIGIHLYSSGLLFHVPGRPSTLAPFFFFFHSLEKKYISFCECIETKRGLGGSGITDQPIREILGPHNYKLTLNVNKSKRIFLEPCAPIRFGKQQVLQKKRVFIPFKICSFVL